MKKLLTILLFVGTTAFAQIPSKLDDLKSKKDAAIKRIEDVYKDELKKLLNDPFIKNDPDKLAGVLKELGQEPPTVSLVKNKIEERWFVRKKWRNQRGTLYEFSANGTGTKKYAADVIPLTWKITPEGLLEITSKDLVMGPDKIWYILFLDKGKGLTGTDPKNLDVGINLIEK